MKTKITLAILCMSFLAILAPAQWQQVGYMIVNGDTVNGGSIRPAGTYVYGCTTKGLFQSTDNGISWSNLTYNAPVIQNEEISCVFVAFNGDMYAGSTRRLYKSLDNGSTWAWLSTLPDSLEYNDVSELNGNIVASYKIGFSAGGAYYSSNAGLTWTASTGLPNNPKWRFLADGNTLYLGSSGGVYRSTDNGQSWNIAGTGFPGGGFRDVVKSGNGLFAGDVGGGGLYGSYDNGNTWANVDTVAFDPFCQVFSVTAAGNMILAAMDGTPCNPSGTSPVKMSADTGHTWSIFMNNLPTQTFYATVGRNPAGTSFFTKQGNGKKVYRYDLTTGVAANNRVKPSVSVFPNPMTGVATIMVQGEMKKYSFSIFNLQGEQVSQIEITSSQTQIASGDLAAGIYFYQLQDETQVYATGKLIIAE